MYTVSPILGLLVALSDCFTTATWKQKVRTIHAPPPNPRSKLGLELGLELKPVPSHTCSHIRRSITNFIYKLVARSNSHKAGQGYLRGNYAPVKDEIGPVGPLKVELGAIPRELNGEGVGGCVGQCVGGCAASAAASYLSGMRLVTSAISDGARLHSLVFRWSACGRKCKTKCG